MKAKHIILTLFVWLALFAVMGATYWYWVHPWLKEMAVNATSSGSKYKRTLVINHDSFSGYAVLRSKRMRELMGEKGIRLKFKDDAADYGARFQALKEGKCDLAVFTVDAYLQSGAAAGDYPGSIIAVIDETKGADAVVAWKQGVPNIQALNSKDARFHLTEASPSEFLARVVLSNFMLPDLPKDWMVGRAGAKDVFQALKSADPAKPQAYVLWEPYVTRALEIPGVHKLLGTEKLQGYVLDVLVASREFLRKDEALARDLLEAYFRSLYYYGNRSDGLRDLIVEDAKEYGEAVDGKQATAIEAGIQFKNTGSNYQHFALAQAGKGVYLEDAIENIAKVLVQTGSLPADPLAGRYGTVYYDAPLKALQAAGFHPGRSGDALLAGDSTLALPEDAAAAAVDLPAVSDAEAARKMRVVGEIRLEPVMFARGRAEINVFSQRELDGLARRLLNFPGYYLRIEGHYRSAGDPAANRALARERAQAVVDHLVSRGIPATRLVTSDQGSDLAGSAGQSVSFAFLERSW